MCTLEDGSVTGSLVSWPPLRLERAGLAEWKGLESNSACLELVCSELRLLMISRDEYPSHKDIVSCGHLSEQS